MKPLGEDQKKRIIAAGTDADEEVEEDDQYWHSRELEWLEWAKGEIKDAGKDSKPDPKPEEPRPALDSFEQLGLPVRCLCVGCAITGVRHLEGRDMFLLLILNDRTSWTVALDNGSREPDGSHKVLMELPDYIPDGSHYITVACILTQWPRADGSFQNVTLGIQAWRFTIYRWRYMDAMNSELLEEKLMHTSNDTVPCAVCRRTFHPGGDLCHRPEERQALDILNTHQPSYLANKLGLKPGSGWARKGSV